MNFGAKQAKLVQLMPKFVPQCRVGIFRNERILSIGSQTHVWGISDFFITAQTSVQNGPKWCN
jgi:hypothetical protein